MTKSVRPDSKSLRPVEPKKTTTSGQHPAVREYRRKLESIDEGAANATTELDRKLDEFLTKLKTPIPPKPDDPPKKNDPPKT